MRALALRFSCLETGKNIEQAIWNSVLHVSSQENTGILKKQARDALKEEEGKQYVDIW